MIEDAVKEGEGDGEQVEEGVERVRSWEDAVFGAEGEDGTCGLAPSV